MPKYIIQDWAGNICFKAKQFDTFEEAWSFIYEFHSNLSEQEFNDQMGEYFVEQVGTVLGRFS